MKRKSDPANMDVVALLQLINTHGAEVTPGSNIVGKDFQNQRLIHGTLL